jgi:hypothetical protein
MKTAQHRNRSLGDAWRAEQRGAGFTPCARRAAQKCLDEATVPNESRMSDDVLGICTKLERARPWKCVESQWRISHWYEKA